MLDILESNLIGRLDVLRTYVESVQKIHLTTLGPEGTSSEQAATYLLRQLNFMETRLSLFETYELAVDSVVNDENNLVVIANAYQNIDRVYMNPALYLLCAYYFETPLYGIASRRGHSTEGKRALRIATHHAPESLIPWFLEDSPIDYEVVYVDSTASAAEATASGDFDVCVTNATSMALHGLEFISRTRPIRMIWSLFQKKQSDMEQPR